MRTHFYPPNSSGIGKADTLKSYFLLLIEEETDIQLFAQRLSGWCHSGLKSKLSEPKASSLSTYTVLLHINTL